MKELNIMGLKNKKVDVYSNGTTECTPDKEIKEEVTENMINLKNDVLDDNYNSIIQEGIYLIKEGAKLNNATMQYLLKVMNLTVDKKILQKIISDYSSSVNSHNLLLDKDKINSDITLKISNGSYVKSEESCVGTIVKTKNANVDEDSTKNQSDISSKIGKNSTQVDDIEVLNRSISSMDLNSSDELMNAMDVDVDPQQTASTLYSSLTSLYSPSVILEKITYPVNSGTLSNPSVSGNKKSKEIPLEVTNNLELPNKKLSLVEVLKHANKSYSNMNRESKRVKRKATDEEISLENNKKRFTANENIDDEDNKSSSQQRITRSTERKLLKAKICSKKHEFNVPESFLPVVRLHRIKLPINEVNSSAINTKVRKLETEKTNNVYNLRPLNRKKNCTDIKKTNSIKEICGQCDEAFNTKERLKVHTQYQCVKKNFKCKKCSYASNFKGNLRQNMKIFKKDIVVASQSRLKTCLRSYTAKLHQRDSCSKVNRSKNSSKCSTCSYTTKSVGLFTEPTKKHISNKLFNCNDCDKNFGRKKLLQEHRVDGHGSQSSRYSCDNCQLTFFYYGSLSRHIRTVHGAFARTLNSKTDN